MKIKGQLYQEMKECIRLVIDFFGGPIKVVALAKDSDMLAVCLMWDLWNLVSDNKQLEADHPMFRGGRPRIHPYDPNFNIYADETINDDHIQTALMKIGRELNVIS